MDHSIGKGIRFDRRLIKDNEVFTYLGNGEPGGKAAGLALIKDTIDSSFSQNMFQDIYVNIPRMTVILTDIFDEFMESNNLFDIACSDEPDDRIAHKFQKADLPPALVGDLLSLISNNTMPLAVRSSGLLEDAIYKPFAGVYETKMIPNNQFDSFTRFKKLVEAIKFVFASTYFKNAKEYSKAIGNDYKHEKMGVIIQEVVGNHCGNRFYPTLSGVARSYNFYPTGNSRPDDGVVCLALGLGKTIVDCGKVWSYSPEFPSSPPPYNSINDLLKLTQTDFWAVNMGKQTTYDPVKETEFLVNEPLKSAENDGILKYICSTYDIQSDRLNMGLSGCGPRLIDFSPILQGRMIPLNELVRKLMSCSEERLGADVEIEFALVFDPHKKKETKFGFLQVRPMVVSTEPVDLDIKHIPPENILVYTENIMGNGIISNIRHIVYVKPESFKAVHTTRIASEVEGINAGLINKNIPFILIGIGRWGSSDPWLGIPVKWSQIAGARVIIESTLPDMNPDLSQGAHFFHNITSLDIPYFSVTASGLNRIDWPWFGKQDIIEETEFVRHINCGTELKVIVDGRKGAGVVLR